MRANERRWRPRAAAWRTVVLAAVVASSAVLTACGLRIDTPPPAVPTPDAAEIARAETVSDALAIADLALVAADGGPADGDALGVLLEQIETASRAHADSLGGPWSPPPRPTPTPTATPTGQPTSATPEEVLAALAAGAERARAAVLDADDELAVLLGSIGVWRSVAAIDLAATLGADPPDGLEGGLDVTSLGLTSFTDGRDVVRGVDAAAYGYEVLAARDDDHAESWARRARQLRDVAEAVALGSGLAGTAGDPRTAAYDVDALLTLDPLAAAAALEDDVLTTWLIASAGAPETGRALALDAALDAAVTGRAWRVEQGGSGVAGLGALPGLPAASS